MQQPHVLIIEDNEDQADIYAESVRLADMTPEIIRDGAQAQARLREIVPSVVILDLHLPAISGADLLSLIRSEKRLAHTRVIVASADAQTAVMLHDQADFVFVKPVNPRQLSRLVMRLHLAAAS